MHEQVVDLGNLSDCPNNKGYCCFPWLPPKVKYKFLILMIRNALRTQDLDALNWFKPEILFSEV